MVCKVPHIEGWSTRLAISFDSSHFSSEVILWLGVQWNVGGDQLLGTLLLGVAVFGVATALYRKVQYDRRVRVPRGNDHERLVKEVGEEGLP
jgi:hypothetical protein